MFDERWWVYLAEASCGYYYCGCATNVDRRIYEHNNIQSKASKYAWRVKPLVLVWESGPYTKAEAHRIEASIKKKSRRNKQRLAQGELRLKVSRTRVVLTSELPD